MARALEGVFLFLPNGVERSVTERYELVAPLSKNVCEFRPPLLSSSRQDCSHTRARPPSMRVCPVCGYSCTSGSLADERWAAHLGTHSLSLFAEQLVPLTTEETYETWTPLAQCQASDRTALQSPRQKPSEFAAYESARRARRRNLRASHDSVGTSGSGGSAMDHTAAAVLLTATPPSSDTPESDSSRCELPLDVLLHREWAWRRPKSTPAPLPSRVLWENAARARPFDFATAAAGASPAARQTNPSSVAHIQQQHAHQHPNHHQQQHHHHHHQHPRRSDPSRGYGTGELRNVDTSWTVSALAEDRLSWEPRALKLIARHARLYGDGQ